MAPFFRRAFTSPPTACRACKPWLPAPFNPLRALVLLAGRPVASIFNAQRSTPADSPCHLPASPPAATAHCSHSPPSLSSHARQQTLLTLLSTATASASTPPSHLHRENPYRAAPVISASEPNSRKPLDHSPIPSATSSSGQPRTHFAIVPSLCDAPSSPPRSSSSRHRPRTWTAHLGALPHRQPPL